MQKTLLDEYAIAALSALLPSLNWISTADISKEAFDVAEAMMRERDARVKKIISDQTSNQL